MFYLPLRRRNLRDLQSKHVPALGGFTRGASGAGPSVMQQTLGLSRDAEHDAPPGLPRGLADVRLAAAIRQMHTHLARSWTMAQLAKAAGNGSTTDSGVPVYVKGLTGGVTSIALGYAHSCALVRGGVQCWGMNFLGQLGNNSKTDSRIPVQVQGLNSGVTSIAAGFAYSCAIVNGSAYCWGDNEDGALGNNSTTASPTPVRVQFQ